MMINSVAENEEELNTGQDNTQKRMYAKGLSVLGPYNFQEIG